MTTPTLPDVVTEQEIGTRIGAITVPPESIGMPRDTFRAAERILNQGIQARGVYTLAKQFEGVDLVEALWNGDESKFRRLSRQAKIDPGTYPVVSAALLMGGTRTELVAEVVGDNKLRLTDVDNAAMARALLKGRKSHDRSAKNTPGS